MALPLLCNNIMLTRIILDHKPHSISSALVTAGRYPVKCSSEHLLFYITGIGNLISRVLFYSKLSSPDLRNSFLDKTLVGTPR